MSIDEEFESNLVDVPLHSILESRNEYLNTSEVWAILKETCVALKPIENDFNLKNITLDVNCLIIDVSGNIKIDIPQSPNKEMTRASSRLRKSLVSCLGQMFKYIMTKYSKINEKEDIFQFIESLENQNSNEHFSLHKIELHADRQLNGSSVDVLYHKYINSKRSEELSSAFQDSFLSTEYSINSDEDTDSDQSLCMTKDFDTLSAVSDENSLENSDESKYFVCLNQLWSHSLDPLFTSDHECLVFIYVILKEMSNILLNEDNFEKCLCISKENVFLNPFGQMLLNFSQSRCAWCLQEKISIKSNDTKYVSTVGTILYDILQSDKRIKVSNQIILLLQKMRQSSSLTINEVLDFCKSNSTFFSIKCRTVLKSLYDRWNHWFQIHLHYLLKLKHKFLYEISTKNLRKNLKPTITKASISVLQLFYQNPSWISGLKYVTKFSKSRMLSHPEEMDSVPSFSAFRPYNAHKTSILPSKPTNTCRMTSDTHFRPLVLSSESNSVGRSQELFSPIDVVPTYSNTIQRRVPIPPSLILSSSKIWRSMNQLPQSHLNEEKSSLARVSSSLRQSNMNKSNDKLLLNAPISKSSSKVNLVIDVIQGVLFKSLNIEDGEMGDRHLLGVADFALSLGRLSKSTFFEAMKQRFTDIHWSTNSLQQLYSIIQSKDIHSSFSDNLSEDMSVTVSGSSKEFPSNMAHNSSMKKSIITNSVTFSDQNSRHSSSISANSESFEDLERQCVAAALSEDITKDESTEYAVIVHKTSKRDAPEPFNCKGSSDLDASSDISDHPRKKSIPILPNKLSSSFTFQSSEDASFYQQIYPVTLLCFPSTLAYTNQSAGVLNDQIVNANKIQELFVSFQDANKTIRFKFKELSRTINSKSRCDEDNRSDRKLKKRFVVEQRQLQLDIESLILSEMKLESTIVEYHSVSLEVILEMIKSKDQEQSVIFSTDVRNFHNLQLIHPLSLVSCLFARGAVSSGLMYDFFLVYREFYRPQDLIVCLKSFFTDIELKLCNGSLLINKARFRLLYILLCWIEGFFSIDITDQILSRIKEMVRSSLAPFIKNANQIIENAVVNARTSRSEIFIQFTALNRRTTDIIHNVDIQKIVSDIDKNEKDKWRLYFQSAVSFSRSNSLGNQYTFSIVNISPKDLATCLTLIQQAYFNSIHPCHILLYLRSLSDNDESILSSINNDRFPVHNTLPDEILHKEIRAFLLLSGQITHWATSEILLTTDVKLQSKIVKKLVLTCNWCKELNNYATMASIVEALNSDKLRWAPFWSHVTGKVTKSLKEVTCLAGKMFNGTENWSDGLNTASNALLSGTAYLPCLHAILMHLKMSSLGQCITREGSLKWTKLRKLSKILDQVRLYKQFRYTSSDDSINDLRSKLKFRIEHLTSISLDILHSHNIRAQAS